MAERPAWFRAAVAACDVLTRRRPTTGRLVAGAAGRLANACGMWGPGASEVRSVFPWLSEAAAARLARHVAAEDLRCRAFDRFLVSDASGDVASLLAASHLARLEERLSQHPAAVLLTVHSGPMGTIGFALQRLGRTALLVRAGERGTKLPGLDVAGLEGDEQLRARALLRALDHLRRGLPVVVAADGTAGTSTEPVPCCGGAIRFRRGPFVLGRLAGAPIVPLWFRWAGGRIEIDADEPIVPPERGDAVERETAMAVRAAAWLERRLRERPSELSVKLLRCFQG
jgi:lauroyl/myristoyl acyltransferase